VIRPGFAAPTPPGTIDNRATGSFIDTATDGTVEIFSNTVTVTVVEVAGITIVAQTPVEATPSQAGTNAGTYQGFDGINAGDLVYFDFVITNVGNDPTAFFIPAAPASVTGGTFNATNAPIQIIAVDPDGSGTGYSAITNLNGSNGPFTVTTAGNTTTLLGATNGYIPADGTVTVRIPIRITETTIGSPIAVVLGQTPTVGDQNIVYTAGSNDVYTVDLADTATNPYTSPATTPETPGAPNAVKEASAQGTTTLAAPNVDFGDVPDTTSGTGANDYQTTIGDVLSTTDDGALHRINSALKMGTNAPDADNGTLQNANADADDTQATDDEDGVTLPNIFTTTTSYSVTVNVTNTIGSGAYLVGWIDFNRNGVFETSEGIAYDSDGNPSNGIIAPIANNTSNSNLTLTWTGLSGLTAGTTYAHFRLSDSASLTTSTPTGLVGSGEVEDYPLTIQSALDYGDAPDTGANTASGNYRTTITDGGPSQSISASLRLGTQADGDTGLLQNANADADDTNNLDDEDWVTIPTFVKNSNSVYVIPVSVTNTTGANAFLAGFIDFNQDGDFLDTNENTATTTVANNAAAQTVYLTFNTTTVNAATLGTTYARFRLSSNSADAGSSVGTSNNPGEVEDYPIAIASPPTPGSPSTCPSVSTKLAWGTTGTADNYYLYNTGTGTTSTGTLSGTNPQTAVFTDIAGAIDLRMSFSGNTSLLTNQVTLGGAVATSTALFDGGFNPAQASLNLNISGARDGFATTVIEFIDTANGNSPINVDNISFSIFDVDNNGNSWQDRIAVRGYDGASLVLPQLTIQPTGGATHRFYNGAVNDVIATGIQTDNNLASGPTVTQGNVAVLFTDPITRFEIDYYNGYQAQLNSNPHGIGLIGSIDFCSADFGDAPDTYGTDVTAANNGTDPVGASHTYNKRLQIGATLPDIEINASTPYDSTGDDATNIDDEDTLTLPSLQTTNTTYTLAVPVSNTTGSAATLWGWIDFDRDGQFQADEAATIAVPNSTTGNVSLTWNNIGTTGPNIVAGVTYARLRLTTNTLTASNFGGAFADGEVEDHTLTITSPVASTPDLLLVKRITALNGTDFTGFNPNDGDTEDDNVNWPGDKNETLRGVPTTPARPGDEIEFTIYFLNVGNASANNVRICDLLDPNIQFLSNVYAGQANTDGGLPSDLGIQLTIGDNNPSAATTVYLTGISDPPDRGEFVTAGIAPSNCIDPADSGQATAGDNDNGAIAVNITNATFTQLPNATASGTPDNAYGFIRFRARVK